MSVLFPHSQLLVGPTRTVLISGPHIQLLDSSNGNLLASTANFADAEKEAVVKSGPVRCAAVDGSNTHLITSGDDKKLKVWKLDGLELLSTREPPKKPTVIRFTKDGQTILASDKFGDIFSYPLTPPADPAPTAPKTKLSSHENTSGGQLVLGHASLLTSFILTPDEKYIITADRDEHIRVSWYPQGYNVEMYCLGHQKYVSAIHLPPNAPSTLISGGGDPMLKVWDWMTGKLQHEIPILSIVEPLIKVRPIKRKRGDDDGNDGERRPPGRKARGKKNKAKGKAGEAEADEAAVETPVVVPEPEEPTLIEPAASSAPMEPALVVHKIETLDSYILFSAVGASALFAVLDPFSGATGEIQTLEFDVPVIDFFLQSDKSIWILLDSQWNGTEGVPSTVIATLVDGKLTRSTTPNPLLTSLTNTTTLLLATPEDIKTLDLYNAVTSMPKNNDVEHDAMERHEDAPVEGSGSATPVEPKGKGKGKKDTSMNKKQLGRLKNKQTLAGMVEGGAGEPMDERETKRSKSEHGDGDIVME